MSILVWVRDRLFGKPKVEAPAQPVVTNTPAVVKKSKPAAKKQTTPKAKKPTTKKTK